MGSLETVGQRDIHRWAVTLAALVLAAIADGGCSGATDSQPVAAIHIQPATVGVLVQGQTTLRATAVDAAGKVLAMVPMHWSSADTDIATVSGNGVVTAATPGRVNIAASADGVTGVAIVTVSPLIVAQVVVVPETLMVMPKATGQLEAAAFDPSGNKVTGLSTIWGSSHQSIATVDPSGEVTGVSPGTSTVTAAMGGHTASATVVVQKPPRQPTTTPTPPTPTPTPPPAPTPPVPTPPVPTPPAPTPPAPTPPVPTPPAPTPPAPTPPAPTPPQPPGQGPGQGPPGQGPM